MELSLWYVSTCELFCDFNLCPLSGTVSLEETEAIVFTPSISAYAMDIVDFDPAKECFIFSIDVLPDPGSSTVAFSGQYQDEIVFYVYIAPGVSGSDAGVSA